MKLLLTGAYNYSDEERDRLACLGCEVFFLQDEIGPLDDEFEDVDAVVCNALFLHHDIKRFKNLKFIQLTSVGLERVPLDYINEKRIILYNAGNVYSIPMAEWAVLKILEIYKQSGFFYSAQLKKQWEKRRDIIELAGKSASIVGFGNVGKEIASRLKAFGVKIIGVDICEVNSSLLDAFYDISNLDEALSKSDIVILTLPLTEETRHLLDFGRLDRMKDDMIIINVSRGGIIDEVSLAGFLAKGKFSGVALDVFNEEPLVPDSPLWNFNNVIITPHNSFISDRASERLFDLIFNNLKDFLDRNLLFRWINTIMAI